MGMLTPANLMIRGGLLMSFMSFRRALTKQAPPRAALVPRSIFPPKQDLTFTPRLPTNHLPTLASLNQCSKLDVTEPVRAAGEGRFLN